jgi:hypothetical protein
MTQTCTRGSLIKFRPDFDQYVNLRPARCSPACHRRWPTRQPGDIDMMIVRERWARPLPRRCWLLPAPRTARHSASRDEPLPRSAGSGSSRLRAGAPLPGPPVDRNMTGFMCGTPTGVPRQAAHTTDGPSVSAR